MGRSYTPKYRIEITDTRQRNSMAWKGKVSEKRLEDWVLTYGKSLEPGGANEHISKEIGYIPYPLSADIVHQETRRVVARWVAPAFFVWS